MVTTIHQLKAVESAIYAAEKAAINNLEDSELRQAILKGLHASQKALIDEFLELGGDLTEWMFWGTGI